MNEVLLYGSRGAYLQVGPSPTRAARMQVLQCDPTAAAM